MQQVQITLLIAQSGNNRFALSRSRSRGDQGRDVNGNVPRETDPNIHGSRFLRSVCRNPPPSPVDTNMHPVAVSTRDRLRSIFAPPFIFLQLIILKGDTDVDDAFKLTLNLTR